MTIGTRVSWCLLGIAALLCAARPAAAENDHLTGYKIKEAVTPYLSQHTLQDALGSGNCTLKKAKFYLTGAEKDAADDPRGGPAGDYICYTAKCDLPEPTLPLKDDQLGSHALDAKKVKIVCLPADHCAAGARVGGSCWFLGNDGESCDTVCAGQGLAYDSATETYAGSGGTDENCQAVWAAIGGPGSFSPTPISCSNGLGCAGSYFELPPLPGIDIAYRCAPTTTASASGTGVKRACACQPAVTDGCGDGNLDGGEQCDGGDDAACPGNCQPDCTCGSTCPSPGVVVAGACWVGSDPSQDCDAACATISKTCDEVTTRDYAGSGGTTANCGAVMSALSNPGPTGEVASCSDGAGCFTAFAGTSSRCLSPTTTCAAIAPGGGARVCACQ